MIKVQTWLDNREINKLLEEYRYSLLRYIERHRHDKDESNWLLILALMPMFAMMAFIEQIPKESSIFALIGVMAWVIGILFLPAFYDEYIKSANTLTVESTITPADKEHRDDRYCLLRNVTFGTPVRISDDIVDEVKKVTAQDIEAILELSFFRRMVKTDIERELAEALDRKAEEIGKSIEERIATDDELEDDDSWLICTMHADGDKIPAITLWEGIPKSECDFKKKSVYLPSGFANIQSTRVSFVECDPIKTSITYKDRVLDVEFPLFKVYETQKSKLRRIDTGEVRLPSTTAEIAATVTKKVIDTDVNEKTYMNVVEERNKNAEALRRALDNEREERAINPPELKKATTREEQIKLVLTYVFMIALGYLLHSALLG